MVYGGGNGGDVIVLGRYNNNGYGYNNNVLLHEIFLCFLPLFYGLSQNLLPLSEFCFSFLYENRFRFTNLIAFNLEWSYVS
jgi:hypothetical protein